MNKYFFLIVFALAFNSYAGAKMKLSTVISVVNDGTNEFVCVEDKESFFCENNKKTLIFAFTESEDSSIHDLVDLKKKISAPMVNAMTVSKVLATSSLYIDGRAWIKSTHKNAVLPDWYSTFYGIVRGTDRIIVSVSCFTRSSCLKLESSFENTKRFLK